MDAQGGRFDDSATTEPMAGESAYVSQQAPSRAPDGRRGGGRPIETRPFFLTSEFLATLLAIVALGITAGVMDVVNARLTWIVTAALVVGYVLSRGLAKAGSESHSLDPREQLLDDTAGDVSRRRPARVEEPSYGPWGVVGDYFERRRARQPVETTPFFLTSEFLATLLAVVALSITAGAIDNLGARLTWILIAALASTYAVSRGLAKAGTSSYSTDPREELFRREAEDGGQGQTVGPVSRSNAIETRPFFLTSEFLGTLLAIVAIAISAASIDILEVRLTWILITAMVCGYVLSRGIAKIGTKSHALDPREALLQQMDGGSDRRSRERAAQT